MVTVHTSQIILRLTERHQSTHTSRGILLARSLLRHTNKSRIDKVQSIRPVFLPQSFIFNPRSKRLPHSAFHIPLHRPLSYLINTLGIYEFPPSLSIRFPKYPHSRLYLFHPSVNILSRDEVIYMIYQQNSIRFK